MVAVMAVAAGCADKRARVRPIKVGTVDTGPQSLEAARRQLEGTWELAALTSGPGAAPLKASGRMTYDAYGNMSVKGTIEGVSSSAAALLDYQGRAVIDAAKQQLRLVGDAAPGAATPAEMSADKLRQFAFEGDLLKISTIDASGAIIATATWRKVQ
jgi:hypothetical protein